MTISLEIDRTEGPEGPALALTWAIGPSHLPTDPIELERLGVSGWLRFSTQLDPSAAFHASEVVMDVCGLRGSLPDAVTVPTVLPTGLAADVTAPREFWRAVSSALEIAAARIGVGSPDVRQRIDLTKDGKTVRASAARGGWQLITPGA